VPEVKQNSRLAVVVSIVELILLTHALRAMNWSCFDQARQMDQVGRRVLMPTPFGVVEDFWLDYGADLSIGSPACIQPCFPWG
jgi:hypothetical protein